MKFEDMKFPVYRKYKNGRNYFKIINPLLFEEIQLIGSKKIIRQTEVKMLPERNFIHDLLFNYAEIADEIDAEEYESLKFHV